MSKVYDFIKECRTFFVVTNNGDFPAARPFGAIMENNDKLYIQTGIKNDVHNQLRNNGNIQIVAKKSDTREWVRVNAKAIESNDLSLKEKFFKECPILTTKYGDFNNPNFLMFELTIVSEEFK